MEENNKKKSKWLWAISGVVLFTLTGCGLYPKHPGMWPAGPWGDLLKFVSGVLDFFAHHTGNNYGVSLLIVTFLIRLLLFPLMFKQLKQAKVMQEMQPQIAKIRSQYKGDSRKIQEETMKLWQTAGVNPMAGCLPMLLQLPILYALYGAIYGNASLNSSTFLGIFQLGHPDKFFILPILAAASTFLSSKLMMTGQDQQQKMMVYIMPVFVLLMGSRLPSGLALYWIYSNLFTALQSYIVRVRPQRLAAANAQTANTKTVKAKVKASDGEKKSVKGQSNK